jgi:hypothetical protein
MLQNRHQAKIVRRDKEDYFKLMKGTIDEEDITIVNTCALNINRPNFIK